MSENTQIWRVSSSPLYLGVGVQEELMALSDVGHHCGEPMGIRLHLRSIFNRSLQNRQQTLAFLMLAVILFQRQESFLVNLIGRGGPWFSLHKKLLLVLNISRENTLFF